MNAGRRISLALALSLILFLPVAYASNPITLTSPNPQGPVPFGVSGGHFGWSVAINEGDPIVVIGAPDETANAQAGAGNAYVLDTTTGLITPLTSPSPTSREFGLSVAVSGTTVVVGSPDEDANAKLEAGHAYVFDATSGSLISTLTSPTPQVFGRFGLSVSISGTTVVVGASDETASAQAGAGNAYIFDATSGSLITTLTSPSPPTSSNSALGGLFGWSVAVSGTTVVVGAPGETVNAVAFAGHAYVFDASTGSPITTLTSPYAATSGRFGYSVSISCTTVVVGAPFETAYGQAGAGHAFTFDATTGFLTITLSSQNAESHGRFGNSVAVGGTAVVVGAPFETGSGFAEAGHAYIFP